MNERFASVWDALPPGLHNTAKSPPESLSGAGGMVAHETTNNATKAIYGAMPIASFNWTKKHENATHAGCMEIVGFANE